MCTIFLHICVCKGKINEKCSHIYFNIVIEIERFLESRKDYMSFYLSSFSSTSNIFQIIQDKTFTPLQRIKYYISNIFQIIQDKTFTTAED